MPCLLLTTLVDLHGIQAPPSPSSEGLLLRRNQVCLLDMRPEDDIECPCEGLVTRIQAGYGSKLARLTGTPLLKDEDCSSLDEPLGKLQRTIGKLPHQASQHVTGPRKGLKPECIPVWLLVGRHIPGPVPVRERDITVSLINLPPGLFAPGDYARVPGPIHSIRFPDCPPERLLLLHSHRLPLFTSIQGA